MEIADMRSMYVYGLPDKNSVHASRPVTPPQTKYDNGLSFGPYHANYWSMIEGTVESAGVPLNANGGYISPYGSVQDPFYPAIQDPDMPVTDDIPWAITPPCTDGLFTHSRSTTYTPGHPSPYLDTPTWGSYQTADPMSQLQSLPVLDQLASQILSTFVSGSIQDFLEIVISPDTGKGQAYATLQGLFEQTKRIYSRDELFIDHNTLQFNSTAFARTVRKANLATFVISIFRGRDIPFIELDEAFLDIFMPAGSRLLKSEAALYLELKTQAFIALLSHGNLQRGDALEKLFPRDLHLVILRRRADPTHLAPSEQDFISRASTRRQYLSAGSNTLDAMSLLPQKYDWRDFLDEVLISVKRALEGIESVKESYTSPLFSPSHAPEDPITKATLAAHAAICGHRSMHRSPSLSSSASSNNPSVAPNQTISFADTGSFGKHTRPDTASSSPTTPSTANSLHMSYGRTSHPNVHKTLSGAIRRPNAPSPRRPWTAEEEKALMDGLDRVKGPHWSQILALYGAGGSISEVLKDRNQVQLKDKARNLKLFFLKSGVEVPGYLKRVTGELRTRAPGQAARRERERRREEEARARREAGMDRINA